MSLIRGKARYRPRRTVARKRKAVYYSTVKGTSIRIELDPATFEEAIFEGASNAILRIGDAIVREAKAKVPVKTGRLRDSISIAPAGWEDPVPRGATPSGVVPTWVKPTRAEIRVGGWTEYAYIVEKRKPYLRPAISAVKPKISDMVETNIRGAIGAGAFAAAHRRALGLPSPGRVPITGRVR